MKFKVGDKVKCSKRILEGIESPETVKELKGLIGKIGTIIEIFDYDTKYPYDIEFPGDEDLYALSEGELEYV